MNSPHRREPERLTLADRAWMAFGCALGGVVVACVALVVVGMSVQDFTPRWPAFAFAASLAGLAGFLIGPAMADVFAALISGVYVGVVYQMHSPWTLDRIRVPHLRMAAVLFALVLIGGTVLLSLP